MGTALSIVQGGGKALLWVLKRAVGFIVSTQGIIFLVVVGCVVAIVIYKNNHNPAGAGAGAGAGAEAEANDIEFQRNSGNDGQSLEDYINLHGQHSLRNLKVHVISSTEPLRSFRKQRFLISSSAINKSMRIQKKIDQSQKKSQHEKQKEIQIKDIEISSVKSQDVIQKSSSEKSYRSDESSNRSKQSSFQSRNILSPPENNSQVSSISSNGAKRTYALVKCYFSNKLKYDAVMLECGHEFSEEEIKGYDYCPKPKCQKKIMQKPNVVESTCFLAQEFKLKMEKKMKTLGDKQVKRILGVSFDEL